MSGAQHTPGWSGVGFILDYDGFGPGDVGFILNVPGGHVVLGDVRKAAAAPDLLEALQAVMQHVRTYPSSRKARALAAAAIAKATGAAS